ncbi:hypothetical protein Tco_0810260 [Tanacetum coccineum]
MERKQNESYDKYFNLDAELLKSQNAHNNLLKRYPFPVQYKCKTYKYSVFLLLHNNDESPLVDSGFVVPVFSLGDYPIAYLNKEMAFSNSCSFLKGRQGQSYSGSGYKNNATIYGGNNASGQATVVKCYNCQGEAQKAGQILDEEQLAFLADPGVPDGQVVQTIIPNNVAFQTEDLNTYDFDCDDISNAKAILMANISNYGFNVISKANVQDTNLQTQQDSMILSVIEQMLEQMINHVNNWEKANKEQNTEQAFWLRMSNPTSKPSDASPVKIEAPKELSKIRTTPDARTEGEWGITLEMIDSYNNQSQDVLLTVMNSMSLFGESVNMDRKRKESYEKCFNLEAELLKSQNAFNDLLKGPTICKLKDIIKSMREKTKEENIKYDYGEIKTKNVELENTAENEDLKPQIQDKVFVITSLKNDLQKLKGKEIVDIVAQIQSANTIVTGMFKLDLEPLAPRSKPTCNKNNDRISRTPSRNMKNKVEAQSRKVNKKNRVVEPICDVDVKYSLINSNSEPICANCKKSMFDGVHNKCLLDFVENVISRAKSAKKHKKTKYLETYGSCIR